jgi:hypothetical protein
MPIQYDTGLKKIYYKTVATITAVAGQFRLGVTDYLAWRNNANTADLPLAVNGSDQLTFNGSIVSTGGATPPGGSTTQIQFNDAGAFGGDAGLTYVKATDTLTIVGPIVSTVSTGTAPFTVASTTLVSNLNADLLDGQDGSFYSGGSNFKRTFMLMGG